MDLRALGVFFCWSAAAWVAAAQASPYEKALAQVLDSFDKIGATLKTIVDEESAGAAKPALRKSADAFVDARAKAAKLQPPDKEEKLRLEKLFKPKIEEALKKMTIQVRRVELVPGGKEALKEIAGVLKKDDKK